MTDLTNDIRMVPLQALHESRAQCRKLQTELALLRAQQTGWLAERSALMALIERMLVGTTTLISTATSSTMRFSHGRNP
jgi:hypothetical protein